MLRGLTPSQVVNLCSYTAACVLDVQVMIEVKHAWSMAAMELVFDTKFMEEPRYEN